MIEKREAERWNVVTSKKMRKELEKPRFYKREITNAELNLDLKEFFEGMEN